MANYHLAILKRPYLDAIVRGRKTIESRFMKIRRRPCGHISVGDKIFLKESSGAVCATANVAAVRSYENLTRKQILEVKAKYNYLICGSDEYWENKMDCRFGVLVWLINVESIEPVQIDKKDLRGWVVLTEKENFGLVGVTRRS